MESSTPGAYSSRVAVLPGGEEHAPLGQYYPERHPRPVQRVGHTRGVGSALQSFPRVIHRESLREAPARELHRRGPRGRTRLVSRALRSGAEEPDKLLALAFGQSADRL